MKLDDFRRRTADLPGDLVVAAWTPAGYVPVLEVMDQASDAVPGPAGTDPMTEDTTGVLLLDVQADDGPPPAGDHLRALMEEHEEIAALRDADFDHLPREALVASIHYLATIIVGPG